MANRPQPTLNLTISIKLDPEHRKFLEAEAERNGGASLASVIRRLIQEAILADREKAA